MADDVASPCIKKCSLDEQGVCSSCFRSIQEIVVWPYAGNEIKRQIVENARMRKREGSEGSPSDERS